MSSKFLLSLVENCPLEVLELRQNYAVTEEFVRGIANHGDTLSRLVRLNLANCASLNDMAILALTQRGSSSLSNMPPLPSHIPPTLGLLPFSLSFYP